MKKNFDLEADFNNPHGKMHIKISMLYFKEKDIHIVYSPHVEVYGYGATEEDAINSFNISLGEFLDYTTNKKTLHIVLTELGWILKKGTQKHPKKIIAPDWNNLLKTSNDLNKILSTQDFKKSDKEIAIPA